jgi:DNA-binding transcriptional LysR family regulator
VELRHLRYFVAVAEDLSFRGASDRLHIAQPALTHQIQALERILGARLLNRTKRSVELTEAGSLFLEEARMTLRQAERARQVGERAGRGELGCIEIGYVSSTPATGVLSSSVFSFRQAYPSVDLRLTEMDMDRQLEGLGEGCLDVGFIRPPVPRYPLGVVAVTILNDPVIVALRKDHPLAVQTAIPVSALANEPFITTHLEEGIGFYKHMMSVCRQGGFSPRVVQRARQFATIVSLVGAGLGVALVPASMRCLQLPGVTYRPLADAREHAELAVAFRRAERAPAVKAFLEQMRGVAKRLMESRPAEAFKDARLVEGSKEHTKSCVTGIDYDSLSGTELRGSGANGRSN